MSSVACQTRNKLLTRIIGGNAMLTAPNAQRGLIVPFSVRDLYEQCGSTGGTCNFFAGEPRKSTRRGPRHSVTAAQPGIAPAAVAPASGGEVGSGAARNCMPRPARKLWISADCPRSPHCHHTEHHSRALTGVAHMIGKAVTLRVFEVVIVGCTS